MSIIEAAPSDRLEQSKIAKLMAVAEELQVPDARFFEVMAHAPGYAEALFDAMYKAHAEGNVDHKLKEIIRIQLCRLAKDSYFSSLRSKRAMEQGLTEDLIESGCSEAFETDPRFTEAEKWALRYAYQMYRNPQLVKSKEFYDEGKRHWPEAAIMEIGGLCAIYYGMAVFFSTLKLKPNQS
jgi:hypothetical protein